MFIAGAGRRVGPRQKPPGPPAGLTVMDMLRAGTDAEKDATIVNWVQPVREIWAERHAGVRATTGVLLRSPQQRRSRVAKVLGR